MTKRNKNLTFDGCKTLILESIKACKFKTLILFFVMFVTFLTGIIIAIKTKSNWGTVDGLGIIDLKTGGLTSTFFTRLFSIVFVFLILLGCAYFPFLFPIAVLVLAYRSYLLGLNVALIIILHGFSGALISIFIAFPCQFAALFALGLFYILMQKTFKDFRCFGACRINNQKAIVCLSFVVVLLALCLIESILLMLFSARIILII